MPTKKQKPATTINVPTVTCAHLTALIADLPDDALTASSHYVNSVNAARSRLHTQRVGDMNGAWAPRHSTVDEYIQVI